MNEPKTLFSVMLMTLMNLCMEGINYYQCFAAIYDDFNPNLNENKARSCLTEALITKLVLIITLIGHKDRHSFNINEMIKFAKENKNIFEVDNETLNNKTNEFLQELELINSDFQVMLKLRNSLFAHLSKKEIMKNVNSAIHPFYELINDIMQESEKKDSKDFISLMKTILELYSKILNYFNSISEGFGLQFSADINDDTVYKNMQDLIKTI